MPKLHFIYAKEILIMCLFSMDLYPFLYCLSDNYYLLLLLHHFLNEDPSQLFACLLQVLKFTVLHMANPLQVPMLKRYNGQGYTDSGFQLPH